MNFFTSNKKSHPSNVVKLKFISNKLLYGKICAINSPIEKVWDFFTKAEHIVHWNFAHESWHCPRAENNLEVGGEFFYTLAAKNKSASFVFHGTYTEIIPFQKIEYFIEDGRKVEIFFNEIDENTREEMVDVLEKMKNGTY